MLPCSYVSEDEEGEDEKACSNAISPNNAEKDEHSTIKGNEESKDAVVIHSSHMSVSKSASPKIHPGGLLATAFHNIRTIHALTMQPYVRRERFSCCVNLVFINNLCR